MCLRLRTDRKRAHRDTRLHTAALESILAAPANTSAGRSLTQDLFALTKFWAQVRFRCRPGAGRSRARRRRFLVWMHLHIARDAQICYPDSCR
jgi:hypothetical protein